jgi:hypothetical protein
MALPSTQQSREYNNFVDKGDGTTERQVRDSTGYTETKRANGYFSTAGTPQVISVNNATPTLAVGVGGPLTGRSGIFMQANSANQFYGFNSGVTASTGFAMPNGSPVFIACSEDVSVYVIKTGTTNSCRVWEVGN